MSSHGSHVHAKHKGHVHDMHGQKPKLTTEKSGHDMHAQHSPQMTTDSVRHDMHGHHDPETTTMKMNHDMHAHDNLKTTTENVHHNMHAHHNPETPTKTMDHDIHAEHNMHAHHHPEVTTKNMGHDMHAHHMHMTPKPGESIDPNYHVMEENHDMHVNVHNHSMHGNNQTVLGHDDHADHHGDSSVDSHNHHGHAMTFHARNDDYILFSDWKLSPGRVTFLICLALVILAIIYQLMKMVRARLGRKCPNTDCRRYILSKRHILQTGLYLVQFVLGYVLMLVVMTYNVWIMMAIISGLGLGYFFFGWAEYEELMRLRPISLSYSQSVAADCGQLEQELLPMNKEAHTANEVTILTSGVACSCDTGQSL